MIAGAAALFLAAAAAGASTETMPGFDTPSFWVKSYSIPRSYCQHRIVAEAASLDRSVSDEVACPLSARETKNGELYAVCRLPKRDAERSAARVKELTTTAFVQDRCDPVPEYLELAYKTRMLASEAAALRLSSRTAPGLTGLLEAQIKTLNILQASHERAKVPTLEIYISTGGRCAGPACEEFLDARWGSSRDWQLEQNLRSDGYHPWRRATYPTCHQLDSLRVSLDVRPDSVEAAEAKRLLMKLGEPYSEEGCQRTEAPIFMVYSRKSITKIQRTVAVLPGLKSLGRGKVRGSARTDDERLEILRRELAEVDLSHAPHVRALALGELQRVTATARDIARLRDGTLVVVAFAASPR